ncbi:hypothetical protein FJO69_02305 [[Mycoplasma] falconis]|uniref:Extracellular matrix-binding protein ebh GA module domain-containing protein n=1 Tax=[Mycoplasma] falconis TaxID=92403 RepID=A0A501X9D4_9BACT|nr:GA module-containing protein [[Mycoplasma] falconis]TPE57142.1 hypothetical protein FJO69_02305 [[Mycoplasma] falconis]
MNKKIKMLLLATGSIVTATAPVLLSAVAADEDINSFSNYTDPNNIQYGNIDYDILNTDMWSDDNSIEKAYGWFDKGANTSDKRNTNWDGANARVVDVQMVNPQTKSKITEALNTANEAQTNNEEVEWIARFNRNYIKRYWSGKSATSADMGDMTFGLLLSADLEFVPGSFTIESKMRDFIDQNKSDPDKWMRNNVKTDGEINNTYLAEKQITQLNSDDFINKEHWESSFGYDDYKFSYSGHISKIAAYNGLKESDQGSALKGFYGADGINLYNTNDRDKVWNTYQDIIYQIGSFLSFKTSVAATYAYPEVIIRFKTRKRVDKAFGSYLVNDKNNLVASTKGTRATKSFVAGVYTVDYSYKNNTKWKPIRMSWNGFERSTSQNVYATTTTSMEEVHGLTPGKLASDPNTPVDKISIPKFTHQIYMGNQLVSSLDFESDYSLKPITEKSLFAFNGNEKTFWDPNTENTDLREEMTFTQYSKDYYFLAKQRNLNSKLVTIDNNFKFWYDNEWIKVKKDLENIINNQQGWDWSSRLQAIMNLDSDNTFKYGIFKTQEVDGEQKEVFTREMDVEDINQKPEGLVTAEELKQKPTYVFYKGLAAFTDNLIKEYKYFKEASQEDSKVPGEQLAKYVDASPESKAKFDQSEAKIKALFKKSQNDEYIVNDSIVRVVSDTKLKGLNDLLDQYIANWKALDGDTRLAEAKTNALAQIENYEFLSDAVKAEYKKQINNAKYISEVDEINEAANKFNEYGKKLNDVLADYKTVKSSEKYTNATYSSRQDFNSAFNDIEGLLKANNNKINAVDEKAGQRYQRLLDAYQTAKNDLKEDTSLKNAKEDLINRIKSGKEFSFLNPAQKLAAEEIIKQMMDTNSVLEYGDDELSRLNSEMYDVDLQINSYTPEKLAKMRNYTYLSDEDKSKVDKLISDFSQIQKTSDKEKAEDIQTVFEATSDFKKKMNIALKGDGIYLNEKEAYLNAAYKNVSDKLNKNQNQAILDILNDKPQITIWTPEQFAKLQKDWQALADAIAKLKAEFNKDKQIKEASNVDYDQYEYADADKKSAFDEALTNVENYLNNSSKLNPETAKWLEETLKADYKALNGITKKIEQIKQDINNLENLNDAQKTDLINQVNDLNNQNYKQADAIKQQAETLNTSMGNLKTKVNELSNPDYLLDSNYLNASAEKQAAFKEKLDQAKDLIKANGENKDSAYVNQLIKDLEAAKNNLDGNAKLDAAKAKAIEEINSLQLLDKNSKNALIAEIKDAKTNTLEKVDAIVEKAKKADLIDYINQRLYYLNKAQKDALIEKINNAKSEDLAAIKEKADALNNKMIDLSNKIAELNTKLQLNTPDYANASEQKQKDYRDSIYAANTILNKQNGAKEANLDVDQIDVLINNMTEANKALNGMQLLNDAKEELIAKIDNLSYLNEAQKTKLKEQVSDSNVRYITDLPAIEAKANALDKAMEGLSQTIGSQTDKTQGDVYNKPKYNEASENLKSDYKTKETAASNLINKTTGSAIMDPQEINNQKEALTAAYDALNGDTLLAEAQNKAKELVNGDNKLTAEQKEALINKIEAETSVNNINNNLIPEINNLINAMNALEAAKAQAEEAKQTEKYTEADNSDKLDEALSAAENKGNSTNNFANASAEEIAKLADEISKATENLNGDQRLNDAQNDAKRDIEALKDLTEEEKNELLAEVDKEENNTIDKINEIVNNAKKQDAINHINNAADLNKGQKDALIAEVEEASAANRDLDDIITKTDKLNDAMAALKEKVDQIDKQKAEGWVDYSDSSEENKTNFDNAVNKAKDVLDPNQTDSDKNALTPEQVADLLADINKKEALLDGNKNLDDRKNAVDKLIDAQEHLNNNQKAALKEQLKAKNDLAAVNEVAKLATDLNDAMKNLANTISEQVAADKGNVYSSTNYSEADKDLKTNYNTLEQAGSSLINKTNGAANLDVADITKQSQDLTEAYNKLNGDAKLAAAKEKAKAKVNDSNNELSAQQKGVLLAKIESENSLDNLENKLIPEIDALAAVMKELVNNYNAAEEAKETNNYLAASNKDKLDEAINNTIDKIDATENLATASIEEIQKLADDLKIATDNLNGNKIYNDTLQEVLDAIKESDSIKNSEDYENADPAAKQAYDDIIAKAKDLKDNGKLNPADTPYKDLAELNKAIQDALDKTIDNTANIIDKINNLPNLSSKEKEDYINAIKADPSKKHDIYADAKANNDYKQQAIDQINKIDGFKKEEKEAYKELIQNTDGTNHKNIDDILDQANKDAKLLEEVVEKTPNLDQNYSPEAVKEIEDKLNQMSDLIDKKDFLDVVNKANAVNELKDALNDLLNNNFDDKKTNEKLIHIKDLIEKNSNIEYNNNGTLDTAIDVLNKDGEYLNNAANGIAEIIKGISNGNANQINSGLAKLTPEFADQIKDFTDKILNNGSLNAIGKDDGAILTEEEINKWLDDVKVMKPKQLVSLYEDLINDLRNKLPKSRDLFWWFLLIPTGLALILALVVGAKKRRH